MGQYTRCVTPYIDLDLLAGFLYPSLRLLYRLARLSERGQENPRFINPVPGKRMR
jgi:hypothetical protein